MRQGAFPVGMAFVLLLAGCVGSSGTSSKDPAAPTAEFDENTGAIQGTVTNDENLPLANALVGIVSLKAETSTDSQGRYSLSNLPPGTYDLVATALSHVAAIRKVEVVAGAAVDANFILASEAAAVPTFKMTPKVGNVQCTVRAYPGVPTSGAGGLPKWITGVAVCGVANLSVVLPLPPDKFLLGWELQKEVNEVVMDMEWKSTQMSGRGLDFVLEHAGMYNSIPNTFGRAVGVSPIQIYVNNTTMMKLEETSGKDCWSSKCKVESRVFGAANTTEFYLPVDPPELGPLGKPSKKIDVGIVIDQRFTQYLTEFFHMEKPPNYSAVQQK